MAITNSNTTNQNQNTFDQFFQQQNQTNGNTISFEELMGGARQTNQAENDFLKLMGGATDTGQVTENANLVNEQPAVPSSETAQVQQMNADANATKATLNEQADQVLVAVGNQTPPLPPTNGNGSVVDLGQLTPPALLTNQNSVALNYNVADNGYEKIEEQVWNSDGFNNWEDRARYIANNRASATADEIYQYALRYGKGTTTFIANGIMEEVFYQKKDLNLTSDIFNKLGAKGMATILSEQSVYGKDSYRFAFNKDFDRNSSRGIPAENYAPTDALEALRKAGKFNQGDMYQIAKAALDLPTAFRDGKTQDELDNEFNTQKDNRTLDSIYNPDVKGRLGRKDYMSTSLSGIDKTFQNASPELKEMWEKGLSAAIDEKLTPKPQIVANKPSVEEEEEITLVGISSKGGRLESELSKKEQKDRVLILQNIAKNKFNIGSGNQNSATFLRDALSEIGNKSEDNKSVAEYKTTFNTINELANTDEKKFNEFTRDIVKATGGFATSPDGGVGLGLFFSNIPYGSRVFAENALERVNQIRNDKNATPFEKESTPALLDSVLGALSKNPPTDLHKKLKDDDYKDLAKLGLSLPGFMNRIQTFEAFNELGKELFFGVGKHIPESFIPKVVVSPEPSKALTNYLFANPLNITDSLSSIGANTSSSDNKTQIFRKVLTESVFKNEENTNRFFNDVYPKVFGDVLSKAVEAGINRDDARKNLPDQFEGFLMATEKAMKTYNGKISDFKEKAKTAFEVVSFLVTKKFPAVGEAIKKQKEKVPEFAQKPIEEFIKNKLGLEAALGLKPPFESGKYTDLKESMKFHLTNLINLVSETKSGTEFESNIYKGLGQSYENLLALSERLRVTSELIDVKD
jgi:hypothetical protein